MACLHKTSPWNCWVRYQDVIFTLKKTYPKYLVLHLDPKYLSIVPVSWNKDVQLMIDYVCKVISGGLPKTMWLGLGMTSDWEKCYDTALGSFYKGFPVKLLYPHSFQMLPFSPCDQNPLPSLVMKSLQSTNWDNCVCLHLPRDWISESGWYKKVVMMGKPASDL